MRITFEGVSYSYENARTFEKQSRRKQRRKNADCESEHSAIQAYGEPKWGYNPDSLWALKDINFTLEPGEFLGIAGHTGSGKSTLIQHLNGLNHPTEGRVLIDGNNLAVKQIAQRYRGRVGLVFQYPEHQLFAPTVYEDVAFGPRNLGFEGEELNACILEALKSVQLSIEEVRNKSPFQLSGGQQRRVALAGVLAMKPEVLVLDEPMAGLDPQARQEFLELIESLHRTGLTVVMVSHSMDDLARLSNRILILNGGKQHALGTPAEVFSDREGLRAIGLDCPRAQKLAAQLCDAGVPLPKKLYNTEKLADAIAKLVQEKPRS